VRGLPRPPAPPSPGQNLASFRGRPDGPGPVNEGEPAGERSGPLGSFGFAAGRMGTAYHPLMIVRGAHRTRFRLDTPDPVNEAGRAAQGFGRNRKRLVPIGQRSGRVGL
jgi:hypothetical protein